MTAASAFPRRSGSVTPPRRSSTTLPPRRPAAGSEDARVTEMARMEKAAIEAGRWLRRTGRVSLPVRSRPRGRGAQRRSG
jgi:hypothetical protein